MPSFRRVCLAALLIGQSTCQFVDGNNEPATVDASTVLPSLTSRPTIAFQSGIDAIIARAAPTAVSPPKSGDAVAAAASEKTLTVVQAIDAKSPSYSIPLGVGRLENGDVTAVAKCLYPVSGYYGDLNRWLFYATLIFGLLAREHEWLIMGALATSLTYSGAASIHAMILQISHHNIANNDVYAVLGILVISASFVVPLLNWSSTIKNMGKDREENSVGRTVMIYWSVLIAAGFICQFTSLMSVFFKESRSRSYMFTAYAAAENVTCSPPSGVLDLTADQQQGWAYLMITKDFIEANHCTNPCSAVRDPSTYEVTHTSMRDADDLQMLTPSLVNHFITQNLSSKQQSYLAFYTGGFMLFGAICLVFILLQGLMVIFFGRRTPRQVRNFVYVRLTKLLARNRVKNRTEAGTSIPANKKEADLNFNHRKHRLPSWFAKTVALIFYIWTWAASVLSVVLAVCGVVATEYIMAELPQSDQRFQIDQWGPWAGTGLVLSVAVIYRFHGLAEDVIIRISNSIFACLHICFRGRRHHNTQPQNRQPAREDTNRRLVFGMASAWLTRMTVTPFHRVRDGIEHEWQDMRKFVWKNSWETAVTNQGQGHLRRRRAIAGDDIKMPAGWSKVYEEWLDVDEFIEAVKVFDDEYKSIHGKGYKWQPRVTEDMPLRAKLDRELVRDVFGRKKRSDTDGQTYAIVPDHSLPSMGPIEDEIPLKKDAAAIYVTPLYDEHPSANSSGDTLIEPQVLKKADRTFSAPIGQANQHSGRNTNPTSPPGGIPLSRFTTRPDPFSPMLSPEKEVSSPPRLGGRSSSRTTALARHPLERQTSGPLVASPPPMNDVNELRHNPARERAMSDTDKTLPPPPPLPATVHDPFLSDLSEDDYFISGSGARSRDERFHYVTPAAQSYDNLFLPSGMPSRDGRTPANNSVSELSSDAQSYRRDQSSRRDRYR